MKKSSIQFYDKNKRNIQFIEVDFVLTEANML